MSVMVYLVQIIEKIYFLGALLFFETLNPKKLYSP